AAEAVPQTVGAPRVEDAGERWQRLLRSPVPNEPAGRLQDLGTTAQSRKSKKKLMFGRAKGRALEKLLEGDEVTRSKGAPHTGLDLIGKLDRVHDSLEELRVSYVDLVAPQAGRLQAAGGQRDH